MKKASLSAEEEPKHLKAVNYARRNILSSQQQCPNGYNHIPDSLIKIKKIIIFLANRSKMTAYKYSFMTKRI